MATSRYGKFDKRIYTDLASDNPSTLPLYSGRIDTWVVPLINSGGASGAKRF